MEPVVKVKCLISFYFRVKYAIFFPRKLFYLFVPRGRLIDLTSRCWGNHWSVMLVKGSDRQSEVVELSMQYCAQIL